MKLYKNIATYEICEFISNPGEDWESLTQEEKDSYYLGDAKEIKLLEAKNKCSFLIFEIYPIYKQINIIAGIVGYTETDLTNMETFITNYVNQCRVYETSIEDATTVEQVEAIIINYTE